MKIYGLTGNIGSGKSTVARMLRELGAFTVDADEVAREVVRPGEPAFSEIVNCFGRDIVLGDGTLDRATLAAIVFASERDRRRLNSITHPRILEGIKRKIYVHRGKTVVFVEAPLIDRGGGGLDDLIDGLVVVTCHAKLREHRVASRDGISAEDVRSRMNSQLSEEDKAAQADFLIENSSDMQTLSTHVSALFRSLCAPDA
ncbi:MAG: dephospho-CoA kinase [Candidatus Dadabacteria bacterium]|nr:dephospho-CoA kinase [Candidatus Dadabacteria bacterium]